MKRKILALSVLFATVSVQAAEGSYDLVTFCSREQFEQVFSQNNGYDAGVLQDVQDMVHEMAGATVPREGFIHHLNLLCEELAKKKWGKILDWSFSAEKDERREQVRSMVEELTNVLMVKKV
jgi:hypothetical protein